ncbi:MAG: SPL family radical SAM protein [Planctomycetota bacterium]
MPQRAVEVIPTERKSAVLTPSALACLSRIATVNLTAGCAHGCLYCYARGYSCYPGEGRIKLYANALDKLRAELPRKRKRPTVVYFSPSSDPFQPVPEVLDLAYEVMRCLLESGVSVAFLSKGHLPERQMRLLESHAAQVRAGIGLISLDDDLLGVFEPRAASAGTRLRQAERLVEAGISTMVRVDPILPGVTDDGETFEQLCAAVSRTGVTEIAASMLYLRPAVAASLRHGIHDAETRRRLFACYRGGERIAIDARDSSAFGLSREARQAIYDRLSRIAAGHGLTVKVCACKNPDLASGSCGIAGDWPRAEEGEQIDLLQETGSGVTVMRVP